MQYARTVVICSHSYMCIPKYRIRLEHRDTSWLPLVALDQLEREPRSHLQSVSAHRHSDSAWLAVAQGSAIVLPDQSNTEGTGTGNNPCPPGSCLLTKENEIRISLSVYVSRVFPLGLFLLLVYLLVCFVPFWFLWFCFNLFYYYSIDDCFLTRDIKKNVDSDGRGGEKDLTGVGRGKQ